MFEEEGGQYVDAHDYDNIRKLLISCADSMRDWADDARGSIVEVEEAAQELRDAMEES
jgi:hypothetical protein